MVKQFLVLLCLAFTALSNVCAQSSPAKSLDGSGKQPVDKARTADGVTTRPSKRVAPSFNVRADPAFVLASVGRAPIRLKNRPNPGRDYKGVLFACKEIAQMAMTAVEEDKKGKTEKQFLSRYDLKKKKRLSHTPLPKDSKLFDFRPDGEVWVAGNSKPATGVLVYQSIADATEDKLIVELDSLFKRRTFINSARFVGRNLLLVSDDEMTVAVSLPSGKTVYDFDHDMGRERLLIEVSHNRKYIALANKYHCIIRNASDGTIAGQLLLPGGRGSVEGIAFSPDGTKLAINTSYVLNVFDLKTGQQIHQICSFFPEPARWVNEDLLQIYKDLVSLKVGSSVWNYQAKGPFPFLPTSPDNGWRITTNRHGNHQIGKTQIPPLELDKLIDGFLKEPKGIYQPGKNIKLDLSLLGTFDETFGNDLLQEVTHLFVSQGFQVSDSVTADATVKISVVKVPRKTEAFQFRQGDKQFKATDHYLSVKLEFVLTNGKTKDLRIAGLSTAFANYEIDWSSEDPKANFEQQVDRCVIKQLMSYPLGPFLFKSGNTALGSSKVEGK